MRVLLACAVAVLIPETLAHSGNPKLAVVPLASSHGSALSIELKRREGSPR